jgi:hypothetical protein
MHISLTVDEAVMIGEQIMNQVNECRAEKRVENIKLLRSRNRWFGFKQPYTQWEAEKIVDDGEGYSYLYDVDHRYLGWGEFNTGKRLINAGETSTNGLVCVDDDDDIKIIKMHTQ